jgi:hypothetical protein
MTWQVRSVTVGDLVELDEWFAAGWEPISAQRLDHPAIAYEWHMRRQVVDQAVHGGADEAAEAVIDVATRLWAGDKPDFGTSASAVDRWVDGLPEAEAAAVNGMLGENFGRRRHLHWEGDHPVAEALREP